MDSKIKTVVSGITPSGNMLHIGNYFGAIKPHLELQNEVENAYYFIADLHALTTVKDKTVLENNIKNVILDYLALGLDPEKVVFFRQSQVESHSELAVILANYISYGQMQRMHAFKDKLQEGEVVENINMGLFNYPILMAADILLYKPFGVPVGEDQRQHIELARDIAENFNKTYKTKFFPLPVPMIDRKKEISKVVGTDGVRKMSKSIGNVIGIFDDEEVIRKQIMSCFTDPTRIKATDPGRVEGNPVFIFHDLLNDNLEEVQDLKNRYVKGEVGDVEVKEKLFNAHQRYFTEAREKRKQFENDEDSVQAILERGRVRATEVGMRTLVEVKNLIGL
ncbi:MAG TPA: tryptophan--tRNA ligase [Candidatus Dojkabacteria bacterium]|nr:tryptophan--tRNA ligase [Candidatus Dojkabacteria bacterium]HRO65364.1 tryptophan--tRNA ligase [Candidatus Dojkabacteria bacterium]HRP50898.1 tryptophan--tRNA ligase [Candidatus Dojkabacteria bacterium]